MKKNYIIPLLLTSVIVLTACGSAGTNTFSSANSDPQQGNQTPPETPLSTKLAIGTLKLEDTEFAISSDQAADLLPLWQVLKSLTESDSAAQEEVTALVQQIQETMTSDQLKAIDGMNLTGENIFATLQDMDLMPQFNGDRTGQPSGNFPGGGQDFPGGGAPGGGPDGGFGGNGAQLNPEQIATAQARRAENGGGNGFGGGNRFLTPLIEAVITLLESK